MTTDSNDNGKTGGAVSHLDWTNPNAVSVWLNSLRVSIDDALAIMGDMVRSPRDRELGPAQHRDQHSALAEQLQGLLDYATLPASQAILPAKEAAPAQARRSPRKTRPRVRVAAHRGPRPC